MNVKVQPLMYPIKIVYNKLLGGWYVVRGAHQTPLSGRFNSKKEAQAWLQDRRIKLDEYP